MPLLVIDTSLNEHQGQTVLGHREGHGRLQNSGLLLREEKHTLGLNAVEKFSKRAHVQARPLSNA